jgi:undecaprenyl diphosphate synthase
MAELDGLAKAGTVEAGLLKKIDRSRLPKHIAVIMDGNGRWAGARNLPRVAGHRAGIESVREIVETSARLGLEILTLYAFSVENWKRPQSEVRTLWNLLKQYVRRELKNIHRNNIRFQTIGRTQLLEESVRQELERAAETTQSNTGMLLNVALNYGGRAELVDTFNRLLSEFGRNGHRHPINEETIASRLLPRAFPIRTFSSGPAAK